MPNCSAPATGIHLSVAAALECPVHGPKMRAAGGLPVLPAAAAALPPSQLAQQAGESDDAAMLLALGTSPDAELRAEVARNEASPDSVLEALASDDANRVRMFAYGNPSTPGRALLRVVKDGGELAAESTLAQNPALPLEGQALIWSRVDDKTSEHQAPALIARALVKNPNLHRDIITAMLDEPYVLATCQDRMEAASDILSGRNVTSRHLRNALRSPHLALSRAAVKHLELTPEDMLDFIRDETLAGTSDHTETARKLAEHPMASASVLHALASRTETAAAAAQNPVLSDEAVLAIMRGHHGAQVASQVARGVARRPAASREVIRVAFDLAGADNEAFASGIASQNDCPTDILDDLARHRSIAVKKKVASNPMTSKETLGRLAGMKDASLRTRVVSNPNATPGVIGVALKQDSFRDSSPTGLWEAALGNANTTPDDVKRTFDSLAFELGRRIHTSDNTPAQRGAAIKRFHPVLGVSISNTAAIDALLANNDWPEFTPDHPTVQLVMTMHPNE